MIWFGYVYGWVVNWVVLLLVLVVVEIGFVYVVVGQQVGIGIGYDYMVVFQYVVMVGYVQCFVGVLFDQEYGYVVVVDGVDDFEDLCNYQWGQVQCGFVQ